MNSTAPHGAVKDLRRSGAMAAVCSAPSLPVETGEMARQPGTGMQGPLSKPAAAA
jgi:hypothetical protein